MRKSVFTLLVMMLFFGVMPANAQLGNILKKVKETVDAVTNTTTTQSQTSTDSTQDKVANVLSVAIPSGGTMENPLAGVLDVELVGAYGTSTSLNYGTVYLVFKAKMIANKTSAGFGGSVRNVASVAVDQDGNLYNTGTNGQYRRNLTEGIAVKVTLDEKDAQFQDVKKTATTMQMIKLGVYIDAQNAGTITFKNVPVQWDVTPQ